MADIEGREGVDDVAVRDIAERAIEALGAAGYKESTLRQYRKYFSGLEAACPGGMWDPAAAREFAEATRADGRPYHRSYQTNRARVASLCEDWVATGSFDLSVRTDGRERHPLPTTDAMLATLAEYERSMEARGLAESTREIYGRLACELLILLEARGARDASEARADDVLALVADIKARWAGTSTYHVASNLRPFLRHLGRDDLVDALALARPFREHKVVHVLTDEEADAVAGACASGAVSRMDAAITLLMLTTGIRACDVVALRLGDLDFRHGLISFSQRKTGNPVTVPMAPAVAEAIGRYVLEERPDSDGDAVFLRQAAPHAPLTDHSAVWQASRRVLASAGVEGGGSLLMRHSSASRMVSSGAPLPVVSAVLGHADPASSDAYIETDADGMRACVLPLPEGAAS